MRALMEAHDVNIKVPSSDQQSDIIVITGTPENVEGAKAALADKVINKAIHVLRGAV